MRSKQSSILLGVGIVVLVGIVGYMTMNNNSKDNSTQMSTAETATWNTYNNTTYGYSINYPPGWEIIRDDKKWETEFSPIGENYYIEGEPEIGVIRVVAAPDVKFDKSNYPNAHEITLDGRTAYKTTSGYGGEVSISFEINDIPLSLVNDVSPAVTGSANANKADEYNRIFDSMVSTFKFAN